MENNMPIDDLFRNGLASGEEPMSETAWSNMERMLNGENPYADESSRKRRILPWLLGGGLVAALSVGGWWLQQQTNRVPLVTKPAVETIASPATANQATTATPQATTATPPTALAETSPEATPQALPTNNTSDPTHAKGSNKKHNKKTTHAGPTESNKSMIVANSSVPQTPKEIGSQPSLASTPRKTSATRAKSSSQNSANENETASAQTNATLALNSNPSDRPSTNSNKRSLRKKAALSDKVAEDAISKPVQPAENKLLAVQPPKRVASPDGNNQVTSKTSSEPRSKQITKVELNERVNRTRDGNVRMSGFDTISVSSSQEPTPNVIPRWMQPDADGKYHPRYVVLNDAQEAMAQQQRPIESQSVAEANPTAQQKPTTAATTSTAKLSAKSSPEEPVRKQSKESSMDRLRSKAAILGSDWSSISGKSIPGMSMGVHAAFNNPKNNFGGFQFGLNNLKPFGEYFSLLAEVKFFLRNNSGYSIRDIMTTNKNLSIDTMSSPAHTIYSYQVDSMSRLYNFKHFYALELPVIFQFHYRRLTAYAGLNMAYQFRINTSAVQRNFVVNHNDTLMNQVAFSMQPEQGQDVAKEDFASRWGLGFVGGFSYSFNPQLYVDMRLVRNLNDNAQTLAARDVSANTFKVPNIQLSLGYRFRKFIPQQ